MRIDPFAPIPESLQGGVIGIGNFEGVHRGHCRLLARLRERGRQIGGPAVAVSFDPHPLRLLRPEQLPPALLWPERKEEILRASGADGVAIFNISHAFLQLSAEEFFSSIVEKGFRAKGMVEGRNFGYGRGRKGNVALLEQQCRAAGIFLDIVDIITGEGDSEVSSTRIRREIDAGRLSAAEKLLGRPHRVRGKVVAGDRRGGPLGFPTANLAEIDVLMPSEGVYAGRTEWEGRSYPAACHLGPNPTFGVKDRKFEVHLVGFRGDLYSKTLEVDLLKRIRDVRVFPSKETLQSQLMEDLEQTVRIARAYSHAYGCDLGQTITQWLLESIAPSLESTGGSVEKAILYGNGNLEIVGALPEMMTPDVSCELVHRLDERIRRTFPEVKDVTWTVESTNRRDAQTPRDH